MTLDLFSVSVIMSIVVIASGALYLLETVLRRDTGAGRVWSLAFLGAILTTVMYFVWVMAPDSWAAIAVGNASFVGATGCLWLGARTFNGRRRRVETITVAVAAVITLVSSIWEGPEAGDWAGALVMFALLAVFSALGAVESRRGAMGASPSSLAFTGVLVLESAFYLARTIVFSLDGPDGIASSPWLGSPALGVVTTVAVTVSVVTLSSLRRDDPVQRAADGEILVLSADGFLDEDSYASSLAGLLNRARFHGERVALLSLRLDDLDQIGTAFGSIEAKDIERVWREGVRRYSPPDALIGELARTSLAVAFRPASVGDARRVASRIHRRLLDDFAEMGSVVIPVIGVGVALTDGSGYDADALSRAADDAARRSSSSPDASVIIADID